MSLVFIENAQCLPRLLYAWLPRCILSQIPHNVDSVIFLLLQMRKLRPGQVSQIAQGCRASKNLWMRHLHINCCTLATLVSPK